MVKITAKMTQILLKSTLLIGVTTLIACAPQSQNLTQNSVAPSAPKAGAPTAPTNPTQPANPGPGQSPAPGAPPSPLCTGTPVIASDPSTPSGNPAHMPFYPELLKALACQPITWQENSKYWDNRGTANYRMLFVSAHYLHSVRFGDAAKKEKARKRVIELLKLQAETFGHMVVGETANEQFVVDPHNNFWIASMVAITWGAWDSNDSLIKNLSDGWWSTHLYWLEQGWTGQEVRLPGTRAKEALPGWDVDTKIYKVVNHISFKSGPHEWGSIVHLKKLLTKYRDALPDRYVSGKLLMPMHIQKRSDGTLIWMDKPSRLPLTPVDWVHSQGPAKGQYTFGRDWLTPLPN